MTNNKTYYNFLAKATGLQNSNLACLIRDLNNISDNVLTINKVCEVITTYAPFLYKENLEIIAEKYIKTFRK